MNIHKLVVKASQEKYYIIVYFAQSAAKTETQYTKHENRHTNKRKNRKNLTKYKKH